MAYIDLHSKPFDKETIAKLEIFEDYFQAWLPVFIMSPYDEIFIYDFFAGTGYDQNGVQGSPIRFLEIINKNIGNIFKTKTKITLILNEYVKEKFEVLKTACDDFLEKNEKLKYFLTIEFHNDDFADLFPKKIDEIRKMPSLVYLDQNGIKFLKNEYFLELEKMETTDFLYFSSSSYLKRFGERDEFKKNLDINVEEIMKTHIHFVHRVLIDELKKLIPKKSLLKLYPFTLKKGGNIYGIIFGAKHPLAVDKFLKIAWKRNEINGEANFDIDNEQINGQMNLFGQRQLSKLEQFENNLTSKLLNGTLINNKDVLEYTFEEGHVGKHSVNCIKSLKKTKKIEYEGKSPLITYENVFKKERFVEFKIIKK